MPCYMFSHGAHGVNLYIVNHLILYIYHNIFPVLFMHFCILILPPRLTFPLLTVFTGLGCDTAAVINILAHRNATQRNLIQQEYRLMYSADLSKRLSSELSGNVKVICNFVLRSSLFYPFSLYVLFW